MDQNERKPPGFLVRTETVSGMYNSLGKLSLDGSFNEFIESHNCRITE